MTKWAAPLALTRGLLLVGLCVCWPLYTSAEGTERDPSQDQDTVEAIRLAAEQGDVSAQYDLGVMYGKGRGVPQDHTEAGRWHRLAAEQGHVTAQFSVGLRYWIGTGVPKDYVAAHMWLNLAAAQSSDVRKPSITAREIVEGLMTSEQIGEAQRLAREWKPTVEP